MYEAVDNRGGTSGAFCAAVLVIFLLPATVARAEMPHEKRLAVLAEAQAAFDRGAELARSAPDDALASFRRAVELFQSLVADGVENGRLYYNLGNAYLQTGDVGRAILNYRRAERLIGNDGPLQANLRYARTLCRNRLERSGERQLLHTVFFWHYDTSIRARFVVALGAYLCFWALLTVRAFRRRFVGLGYAALAMLILWVSAGTSVAIESVGAGAPLEGVTVAQDIVVRKGNGEGYDPQFKETLHEGVEFTILDERPGWYKIELPDGNKGWLRQNQAEIVSRAR